MNACDDDFISTVFLVPKETGDFPLGNSWSLLTLRMLTSVYLFSSPIVNTCFLWHFKRYEFTGIPFGYSLAPRVFTKIFKPVMAYFRFLSFRVIIFIYDPILLQTLMMSGYSNLRS